MKYEPHDYQKYAIEYIKTHPLAAILLDMGLGKTSITLTAINDLLFDSFEVSRVRLSLLSVWREIHGRQKYRNGTT